MVRLAAFCLLVAIASPAAAAPTLTCSADGSVGHIKTRNAGDMAAGCNVACEYTLENGRIESAQAGPFNIAKSEADVERYRNDFGVKVKRISRPQMACR